MPCHQGDLLAGALSCWLRLPIIQADRDRFPLPRLAGKRLGPRPGRALRIADPQPVDRCANQQQGGGQQKPGQQQQDPGKGGQQGGQK